MGFTIAPHQSWINLSDSLVRKLGLPKSTLFRIYPVVGTVDNQDAIDHSYDINWEDEKQYWFDIIHDPGRDPSGRAKEVTMVDATGKVETLVVPVTATAQQVADMWRRILEFPDDVGLQMIAADETPFYLTYESKKSTETYSFHAQNMLGNAEIFKGTVTFEADQLSRMLDAKIPPFAHCTIEPRHRAGPKITFDEEVVPLGRKVVRAPLILLGDRRKSDHSPTTYYMVASIRLCRNHEIWKHSKFDHTSGHNHG
jgi:hypothetical protein